MTHEPKQPVRARGRFPWKRAAAVAFIYLGMLALALQGEARTRHMIELARAARAAGQLDLAIERYRETAARPGQAHNATVYLELAGALLDAATAGASPDNRRLEESLEAWNHCLRIDPANASAYVGLARTCLILREDNLRLILAISNEPTDDAGELLRERLRRDAGHLLDQAELALRRARSLQPGDALTRFLSAEVHLALRADIEASYLYSSVSHHPEFSARARERLDALARRHLATPTTPES